ncbi:DoxX family protein [Glycomyces buryatensis]|uniref:DoxX family protein n=1 Tax=Glycomyces buryatensis TaxID=2570927 RepID=A0A4S8PZH9_9ACTN|nr:DoxX family protein [Glycomyces buryatensis]THV33669.1 DoxX family protein [Glycomyces buryatensis]
MTSEPPTTVASAGPGRALNVTFWILQGLFGAFFVIASGAPKLFGVEAAAEGFELIGAGVWFMYFIGVVEIAGGIGLLIPRLSGLAAIGLCLVMVGAAYTNAFIVDGYWPVATPLILLVPLAVIAWGRSYQTLRFFNRGLAS